MSILYLVATPIGNLEDISLRALRVLGEVDLIAAEDTRVTGRLLAHYDIKTRLISYHEFSDQDRIDELITRLGAENIALVSDAGTPGVSDPGYRLVQAAITAGHEVVPLPGPSAAIAALSSSGLPTDQFLFMGFLPRQSQARRAALEAIARLPYTLVLYEAPHRLEKLLADVVSILGDRQLCVAREITKLYEETWRGTAKEAVSKYDQSRVRGEITIIIAGADPDDDKWTEAELLAELKTLLARGKSNKAVAESLAHLSGWKRRDIYRLALQLKADGELEV
jgi:16S rRNA (cytidine1402-2'-O)-methyltransferase